MAEGKTASPHAVNQGLLWGHCEMPALWLTVSSCVSRPSKASRSYLQGALLIVAAERSVWSLRMFLNNVLQTLGGGWASSLALMAAITGDDDDGEDEGVLPLKSWYIPGTMIMAMASSLLKVRKIWILAVHVTLMLFRYMTEATGTERQKESCVVVMCCPGDILKVNASTVAAAHCVGSDLCTLAT